jgi:hypothetical protein
VLPEEKVVVTDAPIAGETGIVIAWNEEPENPTYRVVLDSGDEIELPPRSLTQDSSGSP